MWGVLIFWGIVIAFSDSLPPPQLDEDEEEYKRYKKYKDRNKDRRR